jgi:hypothetical protein
MGLVSFPAVPGNRLQGRLRLAGAGLGHLPGLWCVVPVEDRSS